MQPELIVATLAEHMNAVTRLSVAAHDQGLPSPGVQDSSQCEAPQSEIWAPSLSWLPFIIGAFEYRWRCTQTRQRRHQEINATYTLPFWLSSRAWNFRGLQTFAGWRLNLQTYRIISHTDALFKSSTAGDVTRVQKLLATRKALVTDRDDFRGYTALHVSDP